MVWCGSRKETYGERGLGHEEAGKVAWDQMMKDFVCQSEDLGPDLSSH